MTQVRFSPRSAWTLGAALLLLALAAAGCATEHRRLAYDPSGKGERPVAMKGSDRFFDGQIDAVMTVSRGFGRNLGGGEVQRGGHRVDEGPNLSEVFGIELADEKTNYQEVLEKMRALEVRGSRLPPVVLRLFLKNHAKETVEVEILEINSDLGNFAARPEKLSLAPEQLAEPDPMNSLLGVTSDEIAVKLVLRARGKTETKSVRVKTLLTADGKKKDPN
ncbi:MAG: hypothetical protein EXS39_00265 [Opitutaceae bacterium]|nr:hypothetical protein [Opitutaceae bacterium]